MPSAIDSSSSSAAYSAASVRSELAANAVKDQNQQERQVARRIPGLGNAVDISV